MDVLVARQDRSLLPVFMEALKVHPDYAEDRAPKRLEFYARAVAELKAKEAVPLLVEHLRLPDTDMEAVRDIADAVLALEAKESLEPFEDFLVQYRADPAFQAHPTPADRRGRRAAEAGRAQGARPAAVRRRAPGDAGGGGDHIKRSLAQPAPGEKSGAPAKPASPPAN